MMSAALLVGLITVVASLYFAIRAVRSHQLPLETLAIMSAVWILIFAVIAFVATRMGA
jgi:hypothetical protein